MKDALNNILFPDGIKCIICGCELPAYVESGICSNCTIPENKPFCAHCGRGFFRLFNTKSALKDYLGHFPFYKRRKAKRAYIDALNYELNCEHTYDDCDKLDNENLQTDSRDSGDFNDSVDSSNSGELNDSVDYNDACNYEDFDDDFEDKNGDADKIEGELDAYFEPNLANLTNSKTLKNRKKLGVFSKKVDNFDQNSPNLGHIDQKQQNHTIHHLDKNTLGNNESIICVQCTRDDLQIQNATAPYIYINQARKLVHNLKFNNCAWLAKYMAQPMTKTLAQRGWQIDFITFAPLHHKRLKMRGYNQAKLLAQNVGQLTGIKVVDLLDKIKETKPIAKMTRFERSRQIKGSICVMDGVTLKGQNVLIIDDVFTTGATAKECATQLKLAGASRVYVLTFATSRVGVE